MGHRQSCKGGASFEPRKLSLIAAHDYPRQADSTSRHSTALASRVPRVARLLGNTGLWGSGSAPQVSWRLTVLLIAGPLGVGRTDGEDGEELGFVMTRG